MAIITSKIRCAIVVSSCDAYQDVWPPFFELFFKFWPDCPWPVYLISNRLSAGNQKVRSILINPDRGWATNLTQALKIIDAPYILYLQEDYFLDRPVICSRLQELLVYLADHMEVACIKLWPSPAPDKSDDPIFRLGQLSHGRLYRVSLQAAWWRVSALQELIGVGETGWQMEEQGSKRVDQSAWKILSVFKNERPLSYYFRTAIKKGKWQPGALRLCRREGVRVDKTIRPTISDWYNLKGDLIRLISACKNKLWRK